MIDKEKVGLQNNMSKLKHYEGKLGIFDYDSEQFEIKIIEDIEALCYIGNGGSIDLPKGCIDTSFMFYEHRSLFEGTHLRNFDTTDVVRMNYMFAYGCRLPAGFNLGDNFDTSNVKEMQGMFENCIMCNDFSLGDKFDTKNVINVDYMFNHCSIGNNFSLGSKFDISKAQNKKNIFYGCSLSDEFMMKLLQCVK